MNCFILVSFLFIAVTPEDEPTLDPTQIAPIAEIKDENLNCSEIDYFCPRWKLVYDCDEPFMQKFCTQTCGSCGIPLPEPERSNYGFKAPDAKKKLRTMRIFAERRKRKAAKQPTVLTKGNVLDDDQNVANTTNSTANSTNAIAVINETRSEELKLLMRQAKIDVRMKVLHAEQSGNVLVLGGQYEADAFLDMYPNYFSSSDAGIPRSRVRIENHRQTTYRMYWVDRLGNEKKQQILKAKVGLEVLNTFAHHMFFLKVEGTEKVEAVIIAPTIYSFVTVLLLPDWQVFTFPRRPENKSVSMEEVRNLTRKTEHWMHLADQARWGLSQDMGGAGSLYEKLLMEGNDKGKGHAITKIGEHFLYKEPPEVDQARSYFKFAAELGDSDALYQLAWLTEFIDQDKTTANVYFQAAAKHHKYHLASLLLSYRALLRNTSGSCREAANGYKRIAGDTFRAIGSLDKTVELVRLSQENARVQQLNIPGDELQFYRDRAIHGDPAAHLRLGQTYLFGLRGVPQNFERARQHFQGAIAGRRNDVAAYANNFLAHMNWKAMGAETSNTSRAFKLFQRSAKLNNSIGMNNLGYMYWNGVSVEKNLTAALHWFTKAANRKHADSYYYLGVIYSRGDNSGPVVVKKNMTKAFEFFEQAAKLGHKRAKMEAGSCLLSGLGTERNCQSAIVYLKEVAEHHKVKFGLENAFRAFTRDEMSESFILFAQMAEAGYTNGQLNAGWLANREEEVDIISRFYNESEQQKLVFHYANLAANQNDTESQRNVGDFYYYNRTGLPQDFTENASPYDYMKRAHDFYSKAASGRPKDVQSMYNLAWMTHHGIGTSKNFTLARNIYWKALNTSINEALIPVGVTLIALEVEVFLNRGPSVIYWFICQYSTQFYYFFGFIFVNILTIIFFVQQWERFQELY